MRKNLFLCLASAAVGAVLTAVMWGRGGDSLQAMAADPPGNIVRPVQPMPRPAPFPKPRRRGCGRPSKWSSPPRKG